MNPRRPHTNPADARTHTADVRARTEGEMDHSSGLAAFNLGMLILAVALALSARAAAQQPPQPPPEQLVERVPVEDAQVWYMESTDPQEIRVDTFDKLSNRTGYVVIDRRTGRFDRYDADSRRVGGGRIVPPPAPGERLPDRLRIERGLGGGR